MDILHGVYPVSPTPFLPDGAIDYDSIATLCEFYKKSGVQGITILGLLGEAAKLNIEESISVVKAFTDNAHNLNVIVGVSSPGFAAMRYLAEKAVSYGAVGVMVGPPSSLRSNEQVVGYYNSVAETLGADIPFIIQDYPLVNQVVFTTNIIKEIVQKNPSCIGVKHEDWPGMDKLRILRKWVDNEEMRKVALLVGNGGLFMDFEYDACADGAMTGYPFPEMLVEALKLTHENARDKMHDLYDKHLPYLRYEAQPKIGLGIRKYVLHKRGVIAHETQRKPNMPISAETKADIDYLLKRLVDKTGLVLKVK